MAATQVMLTCLFVVCGLVAVTYSAEVDFEVACGGATGDTCITASNLYCYQEYSSAGCTAAACACNRGYKRVGDACVEGIGLGGTCTAAADACIVLNSVCTDNTVSVTCACAESYSALNNRFCVLTTAKKIGDECSSGANGCYYESDGVLKYIDCPNAVGGDPPLCQCDSNTKKRGATCVPIKIEASCGTDGECPVQSTCIGDPKVCTCTPANEYAPIADKTACVWSEAGTVIDNGAACTAEGASTKCAEGLTCTACINSGNAICAKRTGLLTEACTIASDCALNTAECTGGVCTCMAGYVPFGKTHCTTTGEFDSNCLDSADCEGSNRACTSSKCACATGYYKEGNACLQECTTDNAATLCPADQNKECDPATKKCKCQTTFVAKDDTCVTGKMDGICTSNNHCTNLDNSACKDGKCACADDYSASGDKCVKSGAGIKAAWLPMFIVSGLISALCVLFF